MTLETDKLEADNFSLNQELDRLESDIVKLEAICLIHGIYDFPLWMAKEKGYLVEMAKQMHGKEIQVSDVCRENQGIGRKDETNKV